ncbi:MAG: hypothetical protein E7488_03970 [Ruminococcaceae bacterium]|nr:hypothetical protein [Oscillospiraceae bacterium]
MEQNRISNNTLSEEDKILTVRQGGNLFWTAYEEPYFSFLILPKEHEQQYNKDNVEEFFNIGYDIIKYFSKERVCRIDAIYSVKERERSYRKVYFPPVHVEDGKVNELKQYLVQADRKDLIWADYMYYVSHITESKLLKLFGTEEVRSYARGLYILQEKLDLELVKKAETDDSEIYNRGIQIFIYPHSEILHKENDRETVISYVHDKDFFVKIGFGDDCAEIYIRPNPRYITYDQLLKEIEPIFNKYGWKYGEMTNPYLKAFGCNVECNNCDSYCYHNMNPERKLEEERINRKNPKPEPNGAWY